MNREQRPGALSPRRASHVGATLMAALCSSGPARAAVSEETPVLAAAVIVAVLAAAAALGWAWRMLHQQRQLQAQLQRSRAESHALRDNLDVWQWRTDAEHRLTHWRPPAGVADSLAFRPDTLLWDHIQASDADTAAMHNAFRQHAPLDGVQGWQTSDDFGDERQPLWLRGAAVLDEQGQFCGYCGIARPVVDNAQALLTDLVNSLPLPVLRLVTSPDGLQLREANAAAASWLDLNEMQRKSMPWVQVLPRLPAALRPVADQATTQSASDGASTWEGWELRVHRLPSSLQTTSRELLLMFHRAESGASAQALAGDHESFSYTVSHDLRAPIRVVEGFTKIVKEDYGRLLDRIGNDHLDRVLGAAARMNSMIDALLALSQLSAKPLSRQPVNLSQLVGYIIDDLRRQSPERQVVVHIEPGLQIQGDATLLRVALENLLGNAWKYTGKCLAARIWFERSEHEGKAAFTVRDNGAGFDMRFADRLFGVFQRLHSANDFQGTGVGLASVRRIIRRHGGEIWAEGEVDRGARFSFWIPN